jgi:hypothetical protein
MSEAPHQTWTLDERVDALEHAGAITPPLSASERSLAQAAAEAYYFWTKLQELPDQCPDGSPALFCLDMGISRIIAIRDGRSPGTTSHHTTA